MNIGMIGTDSTHPRAFAGIFHNAREGALAGVRVTHIWGSDPVVTAQIAQEREIPYVVREPLAMADAVDGVMILSRRGRDHTALALPFVERGMVVWVNKPFTDTVREARLLVDTAKRFGAYLCGGTTCKHVPAIGRIRELVSSGARGKCKGASLCFQADPDSPFGGLAFYGSHLVEIGLAAFGQDYRTVSVRREGGDIVADVTYDGFTVALRFLKEAAPSVAKLHFERGGEEVALDISEGYSLALTHFAEVLRGKREGYSGSFLLRSVELMEEIVRAV